MEGKIEYPIWRWSVGIGKEIKDALSICIVYQCTKKRATNHEILSYLCKDHLKEVRGDHFCR